MAIWNKIDQDYLNQERSLFEVFNVATKDGVQVSTSNPFPVSLGSSNITITGDVNVGTTVSVTSSPQNPNHVHLTEVGTSGILSTSYLPIGISTQANIVSISNTAFYVTNPVTTVAVSSITSPVTVQGTVAISTIFNTVIIQEPAGSLYSFNNHATNTNRGWTMDDTMRPVMSIRVNSSGTTTADLAEIMEYEIGNNNANQSTIVYEWYEGDITIAGADIPAWTSLGTRIQYRVYQDKHSSNTGNTFTQNSAVMRHSGIIIGKNTSDDAGPATMNGGATPNMLTLCMKRVDSGTKLDVWFAFTCKELT